MNDDWRYVASGLVVGFLFRCKVRERTCLLAIFERLAKNPYVSPQATSLDESGRELSWLREQGFEVVYWLDHFVKEVRIVEVERTSR